MTESPDERGGEPIRVFGENGQIGQVKAKNDAQLTHPFAQDTQITQNTQFTNITLNTQHYNTLDIRDKILYHFYKKGKNTIKKAADELGIKPEQAGKLINRKDRSTGLMPDGLLRESGSVGHSDLYEITNEGKQRIKSLDEEYKEQQREAERERREQDSSVLTADQRYDYWQDFWELREQQNALYNAKGGVFSLKCSDLVSFKPDLAQDLLDHPDECLKYAVKALPEEYSKLRFNITNLPESEYVPIAELRSEHFNTLHCIRGVVQIVGDVRPKVITAQYSCPYCDNTFLMQQQGKTLKAPKRCNGCGRTGLFRLIRKDMQDTQLLKVEEVATELDGRNQSRGLIVIPTGVLCGIEYQKIYEKSTPIKFNGVLREYIKTDTQEVNIEVCFDVKGITIEDAQKDIAITDAEKIMFEQYATDKPLSKLTETFAPEIANRDFEKKCIVLAIASGGDRRSQKRDDSHILLLGDKGTAKSALLICGHNVAQGSRWVSSKTASSAGLLAATLQDKEFGKVVLCKGALVMADGKIVFADELDKMSKEHLDALHEALENQVFHYDKWNVHTDFNTDTTFIAAANPKNSKFDNFKSYIEQCPFVSTLLDRFDVIILLFDNIGESDNKIADMVGDVFNNSKDRTKDINFLRKYLYYAREVKIIGIEPDAKQLIKNEWLVWRGYANAEGKDAGISIGVRQLEALHRLARASAKIRLSEKVSAEDAKIAIAVKTEEFARFNFIIPEFFRAKKPEVRKGDINFPCSVCGQEPCFDYSNNKKPICSICRAKNIGGVK